MAVSYLLLYSSSIILIITVLLPLWKKDIWVVRIFDYPRLQKFSLGLLVCFCWAYPLYRGAEWYDYLIFGILVACLLHLVWLILHFSPLGKQMISKVSLSGDRPTFNILVSNVFQDNRNYDRLLALVEERKPDIVFLLETDDGWLQGVKKLRNDFPYYIEVPQGNTYGLLFYSRLPISKQQVNYLIDKEIPSLIAEVEFDKHRVKVFGLHPSPPTPQENTYSTDRDAEILMVGKMAKKEKGPCLVIGDLNDVAWSYTTELFLKTSSLLDPRRGRGLYSTFHARYPFLRWPLDHFFVSSHFGLVNMKVEKNIGSDHFPISICLLISNHDNGEPIEPEAGDRQLAEEKIEAGLADDPR